MGHRAARSALVGLTAGVVALASVATAAGDPPSKQRFWVEDVVTVVPSPCDPSGSGAGAWPVTFTSDQHFVYTGRIRPDGVGVLHGHVNEHGTGVDPFGGEYVGNSVGNFTFEYHPSSPTPVERRVVANFQLIRKGERWKRDDKHVHRLILVRIDGNGQIVGVKNEFRETCR